ncbi:MAG: hypothetical protein IPK16_23805 [Anaerolineales bacterium]|nr:hypothetical protein [Anaerolineales bacterium]
MTLGRGVEYVFEAVGLPTLMQEGIDLLARGGALVLIGATDRDASLAFAPPFHEYAAAHSRLHLRQHST